MGKFRAVWELMRLEHGIMIFIGILVGAVVALDGGIPPWDKVILTFCTAMLLEGSTFALNDYFDVEIDRHNKRMDRPLVRGDVEPRVALYLFYVLFPLGMVCAFFVNMICFAIALVSGLLAILYDARLKRVKVIGNFYIAYTMAIPFVFGAAAVVLDGDVLSLNPAIVIAALIAFLAGVGREVMKDVHDVQGDRKANVLSFARVLGVRGACGLAAVFYVVAVALSIFPFALSGFGSYVGNVFYLGIVAITDVLFLVMATDLVLNKDAHVARFRLLTLLAIFIGLVAFLVGALTG